MSIKVLILQKINKTEIENEWKTQRNYELKNYKMSIKSKNEIESWYKAKKNYKIGKTKL